MEGGKFDPASKPKEAKLSEHTAKLMTEAEQFQKARETWLQVADAATKYATPARTIRDAIATGRLAAHKDRRTRKYLVSEFDMFVWRSVRSEVNVDLWDVDYETAEAVDIALERLRRWWSGTPSAGSGKWALGHLRAEWPPPASEGRCQ
jgi:hypothetical protein